MMKQRMSKVVVCEVWLRLFCGVVGDIAFVLGVWKMMRARAGLQSGGAGLMDKVRSDYLGEAADWTILVREVRYCTQKTQAVVVLI